MASALGLLIGWSLLATITGLIGVVVARFFIFGRFGTPDPPRTLWMERHAARYGLVLALFLLPVLAAVFWRQLREFRDPFVPWTEDAGLLLGQTSWGKAWILAVAAASAIVIGFLVVRRHRIGWWLSAAATVGLAAFPAFTGHAAAARSGLRPVTLMLDVLHVLAAGAWLGGLVMVFATDRRSRASPGPGYEDLLPALVRGFSPIALVAVATLIATGAVAAWIQLTNLGDLVATPYGRTLSMKLILATAAFGAGAFNWRVLTARMERGDGTAALRRAAAIEILLAQAVLVATAILIRTSPAGQ